MNVPNWAWLQRKFRMDTAEEEFEAAQDARQEAWEAVEKIFADYIEKEQAKINWAEKLRQHVFPRSENPITLPKYCPEPLEINMN